MHRRFIPSPAMAVAVVALFVAMGGVGYAAATIGSAQIKNNSIRSKDSRSSNVGSSDIKNGTIVSKDINAKNDGQFGVAFHYVAEELNSTEFGFYFVNYHSKEPTIYEDLNQDYAGLNMDQLAAMPAPAPAEPMPAQDRVLQVAVGNGRFGYGGQAKRGTLIFRRSTFILRSGRTS